MPWVDAATFRAWASGETHGWIPAALRGGAAAFEPLVRTYVSWRNHRYDRGSARIFAVPLPVLSVGNLTVGGTGKTPFVAWLAEWFLRQQKQVGLISRGYGRKGNAPNDEARELALRLPDVTHLQNPDRVAAANEAYAANREQVLILDDAFQHRRLARDLDIVLLDALDPFGCEHLLPRGLLREPIESLRRADVIALSRADAVSLATRRSIRARVQQFAPNAVWLEVVHRPQFLLSPQGDRQSLDWLKDRRVLAFCGLGNPAGFRHTLQTTGATITAWHAYPDHFPYSARELAQLGRAAEQSSAEGIICTLKDLVKLPHEETRSQQSIWGLAIELDFLAGLDEFIPRLQALAAKVGG